MSEVLLDDHWPTQDLEWLGKCPACDSAKRSVLFDGLRDYTFHVAPGAWTLWRCDSCDAAYLDPRPNEASIGKAYAHYYTHSAPQSALSINSTALRTRIRLGYLKSEFGYDFNYSSSIGPYIFRLLPLRASTARFAVRHLPAPEREGASLLDIGCGNGSFLLTARDLNYVAVGLDPDEKAVAQAQSIGLDVRHGLVPNSGLSSESFDHICLNHVFEHLHKPFEALEEIYKLLRPGGAYGFHSPTWARSV